MPRDPLATMLRLRQRAVDEARMTLARAVAAEAEAANQVRSAERAIERESDRASSPEGGDDLVEAFAAWLPGARARVRDAAERQEHEVTEVARHRAAFTAARTGLEVIETLLRQKRDRAAAEELKTLQRAIDEAGSRRTAPGINP